METQSIQKRKPLLLESILLAKCPHCRKGNLFLNPNPYHFKDLHKMNECCSACNATLEQEPGFYWGAMFVSYALMVAFSFIDFVVFYLLFGWLSTPFMIVNTFLMLLIIPPVFRLSRTLWIYFFGK